MMQGSLPTRLRVLRAERGLTLREAAAMTDVRPGTLSELERGVRHPHDVTLSRIAKGYGVPVEELLEEPTLAGKEAAPEAGPLLDRAIDAARRDEEKDSKAMARLSASEGALQSASEYEEDKFRAELRDLGFPDEHFEGFIWPLVLQAARVDRLEQECARLTEVLKAEGVGAGRDEG